MYQVLCFQMKKKGTEFPRDARTQVFRNFVSLGEVTGQLTDARVRHTNLNANRGKVGRSACSKYKRHYFAAFQNVTSPTRFDWTCQFNTNYFHSSLLKLNELVWLALSGNDRFQIILLACETSAVASNRLLSMEFFSSYCFTFNSRYVFCSFCPSIFLIGLVFALLRTLRSIKYHDGGQKRDFPRLL